MLDRGRGGDNDAPESATIPMSQSPSKPTTNGRTAAAGDTKRFFDQNGYFLARKVFSRSRIKELEQDFDHIVAQLLDSEESADARWSGAAMDRLGAKNTTVIHTHNVQSYSAGWLRALQHPGFLDVASEILGPDIILHHSKLFQKPRGKGAPFPMHQDWEYFPTVHDTMIAGVIHVSAATDEMGCFRVYPGSHRLGRQEGMSGMGRREHPDLKTKYPLEGGTVLEAGPGDVLFFHYFLLHGSNQNVSDEIRKTVLVQMHSGRDQVEDGNRHPNARLALRGWNYAATRSASELS
jgi:phytanoyl-CoA hydroxylase